MANTIKILRDELVDRVLTETEIDRIMETEKYYPVEVETDDDADIGILKYSNGMSEMWVKNISADGEYLVDQVIRKNKRKGSTRTRHLTPDEIIQFMNYFRDSENYEDFMIFITELFLARRISDTLSLEWSHFYYENGNKRTILSDLTEEKTDKIARIHIPDVFWKYMDWYREKRGEAEESLLDAGIKKDNKIDPTEKYNEDIFLWRGKDGIKKYNDSGEYTAEYKDAARRQAALFRYRFKTAADHLGISGVSTHSIRKSFGSIAHMLNRFDPDCLSVLQSIYVHDSSETTKIYIDIIDEKAQKYFNDVADFVSQKENGTDLVIQNMPVITLNTSDLRSVVIKAYKLGAENKNNPDAADHMDIINDLISELENIRIS